MSRSIEKMQTVEPDPEPDLLTMTNHGVSRDDDAQAAFRGAISAQVEKRGRSKRFDQHDCPDHVGVFGGTQLSVLRPEARLDLLWQLSIESGQNQRSDENG